MLDDKLLIRSKELLHSKYVRKRILQGTYNFTDYIYKNQYWAPCSVINRDDENHRISRSKISSTAISPIAYCKECISNSIREFGYGYFKRVWWRSSWCRVHRRKLSVLTSSGRLLSEDILAVLSGFEEKSSSSISFEHYYHRSQREPFPLKLMASYGELHLDVAKDYGIPQIIKQECLFKFTPCFQKEFLLWFLTQHDELIRQLNYRADLQAFIYIFRTKSSTILHVDSTCLRDYTLLFFNLFCQEPNQLFREFIESNAYLVNDNLLKCTKYHCSMCPDIGWSKMCSESCDIYRVRLTEPVLRFDGSDLVREGKSYYLSEKDISSVLSKESQIDKIYYMYDGEYICDFENRKQQGAYPKVTDLKDKYTLVGWRDTDRDLSDDSHLSIDYPLYSGAKTVVLPSLSSIPFWPEIQFDTYISLMEWFQLNFKFEKEIQEIMEG